MIDKSKLVKVVPGNENKGVTPEQRRNLSKYGRKMASDMGILRPTLKFFLKKKRGE